MKNKRKNFETEDEAKGKETWIFMDTECWIDRKISFQWNQLFQVLLNGDYKVLLQGDPSIELSKGIYKNISKSGLHRAAAKTPVLPCPDVIERMTQRIDHESIIILNLEDKHVANCQAPVLNQLYHFKEAQVKVTLEWLKEKNEFVYFLSIMKGWWSEGQFKENPSSIEWKTSRFRKSNQIIVILLERVFGRKDASSFPEKWIPLFTESSHMDQL